MNSAEPPSDYKYLLFRHWRDIAFILIILIPSGLLALYQGTFDAFWYEWAHELVDMILTHFSDDGNGGFYDTSEDHEALIFRPKDVQDNATPSGGAAASNAMLQLSLLSGDRMYWDAAENAVSALGELPATHPTGFAHWLCVTDLMQGDAIEVAIVGRPEAGDTRRLLEVVFQRYRPNMMVAVGTDEERVPLLRNRPQIDGKATAYVCRQFVCKNPVTEPSELEMSLL